MKYLKVYEKFSEDKWILGINESIFDKIEDLVKGKSDKGKIVEEFLAKNGIAKKGTAYAIHFLGGAYPGKEELSHPFDYLHYRPGIAKIEDGVLVLTDENSKKLQVPDTISFLSTMEKENIAKNWTFGLKQGSAVKKSEYEFDLSKEVPTLTFKESMYSVSGQKWNPIGEPKTIELDEDISEFGEDDILSFKTPINMLTMQEWVDKLNAAGWVKKDTEYFSKYIKSE